MSKLAYLEQCFPSWEWKETCHDDDVLSIFEAKLTNDLLVEIEQVDRSYTGYLWYYEGKSRRSIVGIAEVHTNGRSLVIAVLVDAAKYFMGAGESELARFVIRNIKYEYSSCVTEYLSSMGMG